MSRPAPATAEGDRRHHAEDENAALYFLAFDHRKAFWHDLFGFASPPDGVQSRVVRQSKLVIYKALTVAVEQGLVARESAGLLVDEHFGGRVPCLGAAADLCLAMPVERSDQAVLEFEYGERFGDHIERFAPSYAKVLIRHNVEGDQAGNQVQIERLQQLAAWTRSHDVGLLVELLVPPTGSQLRAVDGSAARFAAELRPELARRAIAELQDAAIHPDIWKLEGLQREADAQAVVRQAQTTTPSVRCVVLGAHADELDVKRWLEVAGRTPGFSGFAVGRSIWHEPLQQWTRGKVSRASAVEMIAAKYASYVGLFERAAAARR